MCMYIARGRTCPFGNTCNYAHYPSDVKLASFKNRIELGLIDNETYRNKPCFDFVATGSWYVSTGTGLLTLLGITY